MISFEEMALRLLAAAVLGGLVGLERERLDRGAGLRTHAVTSVGACLCMLVSSFGFEDILNHTNVSLDPSRVAAQVVSGVGFLGAGTIMMRRDGVLGLTTAASLWAVAGIGLAAGGGLLSLASLAAVLTLLILMGLKPLEQRLLAKQKSLPATLAIRSRAGIRVAEELKAALEECGVEMERLVLSPATDGQDCLEITAVPCERDHLLRAVERLREIEGVTRVELNPPSGFQKVQRPANMG